MTTSETELCAEDANFLDSAFEMAREAIDHDEVPVGCVFVFDGHVIARGRNDVNRTKNPTRHAEMVALDEVKAYCFEKGTTIEELIPKTTLYVSLEPCIMCACAFYHLRIQKIVYGAANERFGGLTSVGNQNKYASKHQIQIISNARKSEAIRLLKLFYDKQNPFCPEEKRKTKKKKRVEGFGESNQDLFSVFG